MSNRVNIKDVYREKFYRVPKVFMTNDKYKNMTMNAKMTWAIFRDRTDLSLSNNWIDDNGDVYFIFTYDSLKEILNIKSKTTISNIKKELVLAGLMEDVRQGFNKPNKLYLINPEVKQNDIYKIINDENVNLSSPTDIETGNNENSSENVGAQGSPENGLPENGLPEVQKVDSNDTDLNQTDLKDIKDIKDQKNDISQQQRIENALNKTSSDPEIERELIDKYAEEESIKYLYGSYILQNFKKFSFNDFETFKLYYSKLKWALHDVEKEEGISISLYEGSNKYWEEFQKEISSTFWRCIQHYKQGKTKDINNFMFTSFKNEFRSFAKVLKSEE
ncbi:replication protein RepA [Marinilactibacillus psychrotolerans]|uniref:replication initiator protein A n=1 Tax=Marinilactibacillus psychrotolerans TaxID=191770 RepID=UPI001C7D9888|nr:replication initiator protein A [Marinilactibacillus psychrotolerans]GEQ33610.1 replication protein RepA [Marinilactibacillus psychrotolerans]